MPLSSELCFIPKWIRNEPVSRSEATYRQRRFSVLFSFPLCLDCYHYCRFLDFNIRSLLWRYGIPSFNAVLCEICNNNFENIRIESLGRTEMRIFFFFFIQCLLSNVLWKLSFTPLLWPRPAHFVGCSLEVDPSESPLLPTKAEIEPVCIPESSPIMRKLPVSSDGDNHGWYDPAQQGLFLFHIFIISA